MEPGDIVPSTSQTSSATSAEVVQPVADIAFSSSLRDIDPWIIEALRREDRSYIQTLGQLMESLINDRQRQRMALLTSTDDQYSLVHRCCAYYQLKSEVDPPSGIIYIESTSESRITCPILKLSELVLTEMTVHSPPISDPKPQLPQILPSPSASAPPNLWSRVGSGSDTGSSEADENHAHYGQKMSSKAPKNMTDSKRLVAETQDASELQDSEAFFRNQLEELKYLYRLDESWPSSDLVLLLSDIDKGFTDLASLAVRYLQDTFIGDPQLRLDRLLDIFEKATDSDDIEELPRLYDSLCLDVLSLIPLDIYDNIVKLILVSQVLSKDSSSLAMTCDTLDIKHSEAYEGLCYLHPVMSIPSPQDITCQNITIYDDSFLPFLTDSTRSGRYAIAIPSNEKRHDVATVSSAAHALENFSGTTSPLSTGDATALKSPAGPAIVDHERISDTSAPPSDSLGYQTNRSDTPGLSAPPLVLRELGVDDESSVPHKAQQTSQTITRPSSVANAAVTRRHSIMDGILSIFKKSPTRMKPPEADVDAGFHKIFPSWRRQAGKSKDIMQEEAAKEVLILAGKHKETMREGEATKVGVVLASKSKETMQGEAAELDLPLVGKTKEATQKEAAKKDLVLAGARILCPDQTPKIYVQGNIEEGSAHLPSTLNRTRAVAMKGEATALSWPLVDFSSRATKGTPSVYFDIGFDPRKDGWAVRVERGGFSGPIRRNEADIPVSPHTTLTEMKIDCIPPRSFPEHFTLWPVHVRRSGGLRCIDIFRGVFDTYNVVLTEKEKAQIGAEYLKRCQPAFKQRCKDAPGLPLYNEECGMRRVDVLRGRRIFKAITQDSTHSRWLLHFEDY